VKSVSRGRRDKKVAVARKEKRRTLGAKAGRRKEKRKRKASLLLLPYKYDLVCIVVGNTLPV
jgi:hypothetical protein